MRLVMRCSMLLVVAGFAWSQALTDAAGVIAGGSVGVGAGKKVGQGITSVLENVNSTTAKAAKPSGQVSTAPRPSAPAPQQRAANGGGGSAGDGANGGGTVLKTSPGGVVKDHSLVPPPPAKKVAALVPPPPPLELPTPVVLQPVVVLPPPPPPVTPEDLRTLASGTTRADLLKLGVPSSKITMFDDGHLVEIYRYQTRETTFGLVHLSDGAVDSVQVR